MPNHEPGSTGSARICDGRGSSAAKVGRFDCRNRGAGSAAPPQSLRPSQLSRLRRVALSDYNHPAMSNSITRRRFLASSAATGIALSVAGRLVATKTSGQERKFYAILSRGRLGLHASFPESVELAARHGFEGLDPDAGYLASLNDGALHRLLDDLQGRNLKFGAAG